MIYEELKKNFISGKESFSKIIGQDLVKHEIKSAILAKRHILIVGPPGIGKTTTAKSIAQLLPSRKVIEGCSYHCNPDSPICPECKEGKSHKTKTIKGEELFVRIQGSPDLTVEDLLGDIDPTKAMKFGPMSMQAFIPGKIFRANNGVLFFDEINRCPEKLQNALLQVLQERKATIGSYSIDIDADFIFIATMNPEDTATEKLSDVLLDRFDVVYMSYPDKVEHEIEIVRNNSLPTAIVTDDLLALMIQFVRHLRDSQDLEKKPSVRASIGLYERSQSNALLDKRESVNLKDIQNSVLSVLAHRIRLKPSLRYLKHPKEFISEEFATLLKTNIGRELKKEGEGP